MKIHQIIKEKRLALGLTQEQIAEYLGVSTPAVNKWEKNVSYPDITLLPPLARLLKVDLNTLLSFEEDLTDKEIGIFVNEVASLAQTENFAAAFEKGMDCIRKYPSCHKLILNLGIVMQGCLYMYSPNETDIYTGKIEQLYERCLESDDTDIKYQTISMLTTNYINAQEFDKAQEFLDKIPNITFDKKYQQGVLFIKRKELDKAAKLFENELISAANKINNILLLMAEIALQENRSDDALYFADISAKNVEIFDLCEYIKFANYFELYSSQKDADNCIKTLKDMLPALQKPWDISRSRLYKHIGKKPVSENEHKQMIDGIINMFKANTGGELDFLVDNAEFQEMMEKYTT